MEIDLTQLPIPDWDLLCPGCRYPVRGLPTHRCPECGRELDISAIVRPWNRMRPPAFTGTESPFPDFGLHCQHCDAPLAGAIEHVCPSCSAAFDPREFCPTQDWFVVDANMCGGLGMPIVEMILQDEYIPYVTNEHKTVFDICMGSRSLDVRVLVHREFFFDMLWNLRRKEMEIGARQRARAGTSWECPACGNEVPGHFELCWNCGGGRPED